MLDQLRHVVRDVGVLFHSIVGLRYSPGRRLRAAGVLVRRVQRLVDLIAAASRTAQQRRLLLSLEFGSRRKPPFEGVVIAAHQIEDYHALDAPNKYRQPGAGTSSTLELTTAGVAVQSISDSLEIAAAVHDSVMPAKAGQQKP